MPSNMTMENPPFEDVFLTCIEMGILQCHVSFQERILYKTTLNFKNSPKPRPHHPPAFHRQVPASGMPLPSNFSIFIAERIHWHTKHCRRCCCGVAAVGSFFLQWSSLGAEYFFGKKSLFSKGISQHHTPNKTLCSWRRTALALGCVVFFF